MVAMKLKLLPDNWEFTVRALTAGVIALGISHLALEFDKSAPPSTAAILILWACVLMIFGLALWAFLPRRRRATPGGQAATTSDPRS